MARTCRLARLLIVVILALATAATGCIDNTVDPELVEVDFLVGVWQASEMLMISEADPQDVVDLIATFDASFMLEVEPSGRYRAVLQLGGGTPLDETGSLAVDGDSLVFTPDNDETYQSHFETRDDGRLLILDGVSEFDFDGDLDPEPAILHLELEFL